MMDYRKIAQRLARLRSVPNRILANAVADDGACMAVVPVDIPPRQLFDTNSDRDLAARLCQGCSVQDQCLEWELRLHGPQTVGVWGGLNEDDRRALFPYWQRTRHPEPNPRTEGGEHR